ncbi:MAG TPA: hypothetical protein VN690_10430 [Terriglobales bacterium]|nr:hypothetical protein [Terriglobales bacterium]
MHLHALAATAPSPASTAAPKNQDPKLHKASQDFEGILISTLWSSIQDDPMMGTQDDDSDPGADSLKSLGLQAMSNALSQRGGLGLGAMIEHQLTPQNAPAAAPAGLPPLKSGPIADDTMHVAGLPQSATVEERR